MRSSRPLTLLLGLLVLAGLAGLARRWVRAGDGLAAQYFRNTSWTEPPAMTAADDAPSTDALTARWSGVPPAAFSVRWNGYLAIGESRVYDFLLTSDGGARLFIDARLVIDNSGTHPEAAKSARLPLARGPHLVTLDYAQEGGSYSLQWAWSTDGVRYDPVPAWRLSQRRVTYARAFLRRALEWCLWGALALAGVAALWTLHDGRLDRSAWRLAQRRPALACFALFLGLTLLETWPLATAPGHLSRNDNGDALLNEWTISWVAHQLVHDPTHLFQANIFHPEPDSLAFSEAMLVQSAVAAPLLWAGASPVTAFNVVLLTGFALTGFALCLVVTRWTGDWAAGIAAGIIGGFNAHTLTRLPHLQAQHAEFLPLALLSLDLLLGQPRLRHAASLAAWFALQALASYYLFVMTSLGLVAAVLVRPDSWRGRRGWAAGTCLVAAAALASLVVLPYLWPYWRAHTNQGLTRGVPDLLPATWGDYLTTPSRIDGMLLRRWASPTALFPGFVPLGLALYAIARGSLKDARARMCLAFGACGVALSFGAAVPGLPLLYGAFPPLQGIRAIDRFGYLGIVAVAVLGGYGVATLRRRLPPGASGAVALALPFVLTIESLAIPIGFRRYDGIPAIYHRLDGVPGAVVAELPLAPHRFIFGNAPAMLHSTTSFYRLLNGYSGFIPASYFTHYDAVEPFPSDAAIDALRRYGVTHVFVRRDGYEAARLTAIERSPSLTRVATDGTVTLYHVRR